MVGNQIDLGFNPFHPPNQFIGMFFFIVNPGDEYALEEADQSLVMTVNPGFGGQSFIEAMLPKIEKIRGWIEKRGLDIDLQVDGGITKANIGRAASAGANVFVAGTSVFGQDDRKLAIEELRRAAGAVGVAADS